MVVSILLLMLLTNLVQRPSHAHKLQNIEPRKKLGSYPNVLLETLHNLSPTATKAVRCKQNYRRLDQRTRACAAKAIFVAPNGHENHEIEVSQKLFFRYRTSIGYPPTLDARHQKKAPEKYQQDLHCEREQSLCWDESAILYPLGVWFVAFEIIRYIWVLRLLFWLMKRKLQLMKL